MTKSTTINAIFVSAGLVGLALMIIAVALRAVTVLGEPVEAARGIPSQVARPAPELMSPAMVGLVEAAQLVEPVGKDTQR